MLLREYSFILVGSSVLKHLNMIWKHVECMLWVCRWWSASCLLPDRLRSKSLVDFSHLIKWKGLKYYPKFVREFVWDYPYWSTILVHLIYISANYYLFYQPIFSRTALPLPRLPTSFILTAETLSFTDFSSSRHIRWKQINFNDFSLSFVLFFYFEIIFQNILSIKKFLS